MPDVPDPCRRNRCALGRRHHNNQSPDGAVDRRGLAQKITRRPVGTGHGTPWADHRKCDHRRRRKGSAGRRNPRPAAHTSTIRDKLGHEDELITTRCTLSEVVIGNATLGRRQRSVEIRCQYIVSQMRIVRFAHRAVPGLGNKSI